MKSTYYPTIERVQEINLLVLSLVMVKKADEPKLLSASKLHEVISQCEELEGDVYDKAVILLKGIIQKHPFASGNRRTSFAVTKEFVLKNGEGFKIKYDREEAREMQGIRENYYTNEELKEWIKNGKIKSFKR